MYTSVRGAGRVVQKSWEMCVGSRMVRSAHANIIEQQIAKSALCVKWFETERITLMPQPPSRSVYYINACRKQQTLQPAGHHKIQTMHASREQQTHARAELQSER
eukprot:5261686-Heterocapsa_arctica.AAC.1